MELTVFAQSLGYETYFCCLFLKYDLKWGKRSFRYVAPAAWNLLQEEFGLREQVSLNLFKSRLKVLEDDESGCKCYDG